MPIDSSQRTAAKVAGVAGLLAFGLVVFGNYVLLGPLIVPRNAADTARNILAHETQFRVALICFVTYGIGTIVLLTALYVVLAPVNRGLALAGALFRLVFAMLWLIAPLNSLAALRLLGDASYLKVFEPDRLQALARVQLAGSFDDYYVGLPFFGLAATVCAWLWLKSNYIPTGIVDLRCDRFGLVRLLRLCLPHLSQLQQNRERLHFRFTDGFVRIGRQCVAAC